MTSGIRLSWMQAIQKCVEASAAQEASSVRPFILSHSQTITKNRKISRVRVQHRMLAFVDDLVSMSVKLLPRVLSLRLAL